MITELTIKCDWPGCSATMTVPREHDAAERRAWKQESYGLFALHLCPKHRRHNFFQVREEQFKQGGKGHSTPSLTNEKL